MANSSKIVPDSSEREGNTITSLSTKPKQCSPGVRWCFTLNNYTEEQISSIVPIIEEKCRLGIFGKEVGNSGTPHLQGYIEFKTKGRPMNLFGIKQIHWEKAKGSKADNMAYCSKEDKRPYCWGCKVKKPVKIIRDDQLFDWQKVLVDIIKKRTRRPHRTLVLVLGRRDREDLL